jgi:hypothetical protein
MLEPQSPGTEIVPSQAGSVGRPTKYRPEYCADVVDHMSEGASLTSYAAKIGVSRNTLTLWVGAHAEFEDAVGLAKAKCAAWWEEQARNIVKGGGGPGASTLAVFGLKNMAPDDWQDKQQHEHVGRVLHGAMTHEEAVAEAHRRGLPDRVLEE